MAAVGSMSLQFLLPSPQRDQILAAIATAQFDRDEFDLTASTRTTPGASSGTASWPMARNCSSIGLGRP